MSGRLPQNGIEESLFKIHLADKHMRIENILAELFDMAATAQNGTSSNGAATSSAYQWAADDWICRTCLEEFLGVYLRLWWIEERRGGSVTGRWPTISLVVLILNDRCRCRFDPRAMLVSAMFRYVRTASLMIDLKVWIPMQYTKIHTSCGTIECEAHYSRRTPVV